MKIKIRLIRQLHRNITFLPEISITFEEFHGTEEAEEDKHEYGRSGHLVKRGFYPPIETIRRAARVLGVCLPSKELYSSLNCGEIRNGVCEGEGSCSKHGGTRFYTILEVGFGGEKATCQVCPLYGMLCVDRSF